MNTCVTGAAFYRHTICTYTVNYTQLIVLDLDMVMLVKFVVAPVFRYSGFHLVLTLS
jgi:hypothetical protein